MKAHPCDRQAAIPTVKYRLRPRTQSSWKHSTHAQASDDVSETWHCVAFVRTTQSIRGAVGVDERPPKQVSGDRGGSRCGSLSSGTDGTSSCTWRASDRKASGEALAADVSRVSRKLHARHHHRTLSAAGGIGLELLATGAAGAVFAIGQARGSNVAVLVAAAISITTFQPLIKLLVGSVLGVRYEYAYLHGVEPRFKMRYGTYLAAPRWRRIVVHLSGTVGSPLAAWLVSRLTQRQLPLASRICVAAFWATLGLNALLFFAALIGLGRIRTVRLGATSGGAAAIELRDALGWSP